MKLSQKFYKRTTLTVAKELLGKYLVHRVGKKKLIGKIVETEAYVGPRDLASHASRGRTRRTELMFGQPGHAYIYLIYGMYFCFNIVTERKDYPAAVLIRAVEPLCQKNSSVYAAPKAQPKGCYSNSTNGPGKLCCYLRIDKKLNGIDLGGNILWLEDRGRRIPTNKIIARKRIGVDYAGQWKNKKWRFYIKDNPFVSKK